MSGEELKVVIVFPMVMRITGVRVTEIILPADSEAVISTVIDIVVLTVTLGGVISDWALTVAILMTKDPTAV